MGEELTSILSFGISIAGIMAIVVFLWRLRRELRTGLVQSARGNAKMTVEMSKMSERMTREMRQLPRQMTQEAAQFPA